MFKEPWFRIIDVQDAHGPSIADITARVAQEIGVSLADLRGVSRTRAISAARRRVWREIRALRGDLTASTIARYFNREQSTVRHGLRRAA